VTHSGDILEAGEVGTVRRLEDGAMILSFIKHDELLAIEPPDFHKVRRFTKRADDTTQASLDNMYSSTWLAVEKVYSKASIDSVSRHMAQVAMGAGTLQTECPPTLCGHLWKKSPSLMRMRSFQQRYVELRNCQLYWWKEQANWEKRASISGLAPPAKAQTRGAAGVVDLHLTRCEVGMPEGSGVTLFSLKPKKGEFWKGHVFSGADKARVFIFDVTDSEHPRDIWVAAIRAHIDYGEQVRRGIGNL
jgi:hypothetical protein